MVSSSINEGPSGKPPSLNSPVKFKDSQGIDVEPTEMSPPQHLSEFYPLINGNVTGSTNRIKSTKSEAGMTFSDWTYGGGNQQTSPSIDTFTSFAPSALELPAIVTPKDFSQSLEVYENVINKAHAVSQSLLVLSNAANEFGQALEDVISPNSKVNSKVTCEGLLNSAALQYVIGSNQQILSRIIKHDFEAPLTEQVEILREKYRTHQQTYQREIRVKSKLLREKEIENVKLSKLKVRNLNKYKTQLLDLTNHLEDIDKLKYEYYHDTVSMVENFNRNELLQKTGSIVRAQLELYEGIAKKGWSGGGLDNLLEISPDLLHAPYDNDTQESSSLNSGIKDYDTILQDHDKLIDDQDQEEVGNTSNDTISQDKVISTNRSSSPIDSANNEESFSLPVVNRSISLLAPRSKSSEDHRSIDVDTRANVLEELSS